MMIIVLYVLAGTGAITWAVMLWAFFSRDVPAAWHAAVVTARQFQSERPRLRYWHRVLPVWFDHWVHPCDGLGREVDE